MNKFLKRAAALLLGVCMVLPALTACGGAEKDDGTISIFKWDFASLNSARRQKTPLYLKMKEVANGYDLKAETCGYADWESTINNMYHTGTLPDVFINYTVDRPQTFSKWIRNESVLNIGDYVSETQYPNIYNRLQEFDWLLDRVDYLNNKWYFIPIKIEQTHGMFVRTDWIDNLNGKLANILVSEGVISNVNAMTDAIYEANKFVVPNTLIEFYRLAKAFTIYDPDNDGKANTYGYTCSGNLMWYNNWVFEAFGSTYWGFVEDGAGSLTSSWITDENKQAVAFLNRLYEEGIMDPDYTAMTDPKKIDNFCSGRTGIMVDNIYYNNYLEQFRSTNKMTVEEAKNSFTVIAPPSGETGTRGLRGNPGFWCGTSINADVGENKRNAILKLLDYMLSEEGDSTFTYGLEGEHYDVVGGEKVSKMGQDNNGYNYTIRTTDVAFDIVSLVDWTYSYNPGFSSNYEYVESLLENAKAYNYVDEVSYVQTPLYIEKEQILGNSSYERFVQLISTNYGTYNKTSLGTITWDTFDLNVAAFNTDWSKFKSMFLNNWGGQAMLTEWSAEAVKYLNK